MMNYSETIKYLYSRLPMFSSQGHMAIKPGLENTIRFCQLLGNPQNKFKTIHVGGTNGKGSTSHMVAAILQTAGYRTGLYTSPHLKDFRERIRVNGQMISEAEVVQFVNTYSENIEEINPSFFELTVALAFDYFARQEVDLAVIEVGLGGRLDSTNIINPLLSIITNIAFDHIDILGHTLPLIAQEKAGIIKHGIQLIVGQRQDEVEQIFIQKAKEKQSGLVFASDEWRISKSVTGNGESDLLRVDIEQLNDSETPYFSFKTLQLDLTGSYQLKNLATVLSAVVQLRKQGLNISDDHVKTALKEVKWLTGLMGRWQTLGTRPMVICDTGHNEDGIREVLKNIEAISFEKLHMVIGMVKDKDITGILKLLPEDATYYFCQPKLARAKPVEDLQMEANALGLRGKAYSTVREALKAAKNNAGDKDLIFIGGSTFVVAEVV